MNDADKEAFEHITELVNTHPISMDGIVRLADTAARLSLFGLDADRICNLLHGAYCGDVDNLADALKRKELSDKTREFVQFWNDNVKYKIAVFSKPEVIYDSPPCAHFAQETLEKIKGNGGIVMNLKTNVVKSDHMFTVQMPDGTLKSVVQLAETHEAARLLMKGREAAGEFFLIEGDE